MQTLRLTSRPHHRLAQRVTALAVILTLAALAGCSSDSSGDKSSSKTTVPASECPFDGTTGDQSGGTPASEALTLSSVATSKSGCVDELLFYLAPNTSTWSMGYATGPVTDATGNAVAPAGAAQLVLTLNGTTNGSGSATVDPKNLDYVEGINVASGPNGSTLVVIGLDRQRPFTASSSKAPAAYVTVGIGG